MRKPIRGQHRIELHVKAHEAPLRPSLVPDAAAPLVQNYGGPDASLMHQEGLRHQGKETYESLIPIINESIIHG